MTEHETEAALGRLAMQYQEVNRKLACVHAYLHDQQNKLRDLIGAINLASQGERGKPSAACAVIDWKELCKHAEMLPDLAEEKARLEDCLRQGRARTSNTPAVEVTYE